MPEKWYHEYANENTIDVEQPAEVQICQGLTSSDNY